MFVKKNEIRAGEYTKTIYTLINEERYADAISVLCKIPESTNCRAGFYRSWAIVITNVKSILNRQLL